MSIKDKLNALCLQGIPEAQQHIDKWKSLTFGYIRMNHEKLSLEMESFLPIYLIIFIDAISNYWEVVFDTLSLSVDMNVYNQVLLSQNNADNYQVMLNASERNNENIFNIIMSNLIRIGPDGICVDFMQKIASNEIAFEVCAVILLNAKSTLLIQDVCSFMIHLENAYSKYEKKSLFESLITITTTDNNDYIIVSHFHIALSRALSIYVQPGTNNTLIRTSIWNVMTAITQNIKDLNTKQHLVTENNIYSQIHDEIEQFDLAPITSIHSIDLLLIISSIQTLVNLLINDNDCEDDGDIRYIVQIFRLAFRKFIVLNIHFSMDDNTNNNNNQEIIYILKSMFDLLIDALLCFISDDEFRFDSIKIIFIDQDLLKYFIHSLIAGNSKSLTRSCLAFISNFITGDCDINWNISVVQNCVTFKLVQNIIININHYMEYSITIDEISTYFLTLANIFCYDLNIIQPILNEDELINELLENILEFANFNGDVELLDVKNGALSIIRNIFCSPHDLLSLREKIIFFENGKFIELILTNLNHLSNHDVDLDSLISADNNNNDYTENQITVTDFNEDLIIFVSLIHMIKTSNQTISDFLLNKFERHYIGHTIQDCLGFIDYHGNIQNERIEIENRSYVLSAMQIIKEYDQFFFFVNSENVFQYEIN